MSPAKQTNTNSNCSAFQYLPFPLSRLEEGRIHYCNYSPVMVELTKNVSF